MALRIRDWKIAFMEQHTGGRPKAHRAFVFVPAQAVVARCIESFKDFPPRAKAASFTVADVMEKITTAGADKD